ncbi:hypothetical protein D3C72_2476150 [compost metagenome]
MVVGLALDVLRSLGAEIDEHFEEEAVPAVGAAAVGAAHGEAVPAGNIALAETGMTGGADAATAPGKGTP